MLWERSDSFHFAYNDSILTDVDNSIVSQTQQGVQVTTLNPGLILTIELNQLVSCCSQRNQVQQVFQVQSKC